MALFCAKFACILAISNPVFRWESCKDSVWESVKNCSWLCKEIRTRDWISQVVAACKPPKCCTRAKHARSWRVVPAVALQDKSPRLARPFACCLNSRLNPVVRSSRQNTLFGKNWLFTFLLTLRFRESFQREFWERNPREKHDWLIHKLYLRDSSNSSTLFISIVKFLRGLLPKPYLTISIYVRELFGVWEAVRKEPILHWLMLWSSSGIREARKEIGLA